MSIPEQKRQIRLRRIKNVLTAVTAGVILLAAQSLWTGQKFFLDWALFLAGFGLLWVSLMVARTISE